MSKVKLTTKDIMAKYNLVPFESDVDQGPRVKLFRDEHMKFSFRVELNRGLQAKYWGGGKGHGTTLMCSLWMTDVASRGQVADVEWRNVKLTEQNIDKVIREFVKLYTDNIPYDLNL